MFSERQIEQAVEYTAKQITEFYRNRFQTFNLSGQGASSSVLVIGILKGAVFFLTDLVRKLDFPVELDFLRVSSYGNQKQSSQSMTVTKTPDVSLANRVVLIVEDVVDSGRTVQFLREYCRQNQAEDVRIAVLIDKPQRRQVEAPVDFVCLKATDDFLVGYGMDNAEADRNVPYIFRGE